MDAIWSAIAMCGLMSASALAGVWIRPLLPPEHRAHETVQLVQLVNYMLVTFAALVLGLMTASAKNNFDTVTADIRAYAANLIELDSTLRQYGTDADATRALLRAYTAAAIASTWPDEPPPAGDDYPKDIRRPDGSRNIEDPRLGEMLTRAGARIRQLPAADADHRDLQEQARGQYARLVDMRWKLIEEARNTFSVPFARILAVWLLIIFLSFGLIAPRNGLALVTIGLGAISIATVVYVIVDLYSPLSGPIVVSSEPLRLALEHQRR